MSQLQATGEAVRIGNTGKYILSMTENALF
jgi:hypothetical protein